MWTTAAGQPPCFGKGYDNEEARCASCAFRTNCRQEVIRMNFGQTYAPPPPPGSYYQPAPTIPAPPPFTPQQFRPQPYTPAPIPVAPAPMPAPVQVVRPVMPVAPQAMQVQPGQMAPWGPIHFQVPQQIHQSALGYYGYYPDQMWNALAAVPPVWRPQQPGESFGSRAVKNLMLVLLEKVCEQGMLTARQMFLPPAPPNQPKASDAVINGDVRG